MEQQAVNELPHALPPWKPLWAPERKSGLRLLHRNGPDFSIPTTFSDLTCPPTQTDVLILALVKQKTLTGGETKLEKKESFPEMGKPGTLSTTVPSFRTSPTLRSSIAMWLEGIDYCIM